MKLDKFLFASRSLGNERTVRVLYPENSSIRYPVLYVHDGLAAFRRDTPASWECFSFDEALEKIHQDLIIVAIEAKEPLIRTREYSPFPWVGEANKYLHSGEEEGDLYLEWLLQDLKPFIDSHYQTLTDRSHTFMFGTSLGGLISVYAASKHPETFSKIGCFSLASWGNERALLSFVKASNINQGTSFFIRVGEKEGIPRDLVSLGACYPRLSENLVSLLKEKGSAVDFARNPLNRHCTKDWEKDVPSFLEWLFS